MERFGALESGPAPASAVGVAAGDDSGLSVG
jgi:hypothetical protein